MELAIVEPPMHIEESPPVKRALGYPVDISVAPVAAQAHFDAPPPPPRNDDHGGRSRRRRRESRSPERRSRRACGGSPNRGVASRVPAHARLGPGVGASHVAANVEAAGSTPSSAIEASHDGVVLRASGVHEIIDDLAAEVIIPTLGKQETIPEMLEDVLRLKEGERAPSVNCTVGVLTSCIPLGSNAGLHSLDLGGQPTSAMDPSTVSPTLERFNLELGRVEMPEHTPFTSALPTSPASALTLPAFENLVSPPSI
ncbi:hypothetical protein ACP70R_044975 [Stipagrostis hirtigluma subsp. patula]